MIEITPELILDAYRAGIFPMSPRRNSAEINWYDPELRGILPLDSFHVPKKLKKTLRHTELLVTFDRAFDQVIKHCADAREETWINDEIINLYCTLFDRGFGHSVEVWNRDELVGGLYGLAIGGGFFR